MRKYHTWIYCHLGVLYEIVEAKNYDEAHSATLHKGHVLTNYGNTGYLERVSVQPVKAGRKS